jgi:hypothetical protein
VFLAIMVLPVVVRPIAPQLHAFSLLYIVKENAFSLV